MIVRKQGEQVADWSRRQLGYLLAVREKDQRLKYRKAFRDPLAAMAFTTGGFSSSKSKAWLTSLQAVARGSEGPIFDLSAALVRARSAALH